MKHILFCVAFGCVLFASCSGRVNGVLREDGSADLTLRASVEPRMAGLIRALSRLNNPSASASDPILNGPAIAASMSAAPGVKSASFRNTTPTSIEGTIAFTRVDAFLAIPGNQGAGAFVTYGQTSAGGRFRIALNRSTGPRLVAAVSPDVSVYLEALMAPVVTGEVVSKTEYLNMVRSVYGKPIADEIAAAKIQASIDFPRPIDTIRRGAVSSADKNRGEFTIPLLDLLVLESPLEYEVSWK
ncbi:MAG: hypothetical protein LBG87_08425 [Spirochaetaceae bacterium]|nr:hypothetical protein [Spirochaetaceae bacterium]